MTSLLDYASARLSQLCEAANFGPGGEDVVRTFRELVTPWADRPRQRESRWTSEISDDNTPIEFSAAISDGGTDVRVLFEPQANEPTLAAYRDAALAMHERLEREFGAHLDRFRAVQDLFAPEDMLGPFAIWNSVVFRRGERPTFKTYFNPQARGPARASALVEEALRRLGLPRVWGSLRRAAASRGPHLDEIKYFALDLTDEPRARVKVYVRHHHASPEDLERACSDQVDFVEGEALDFARAVAGDRERLSARATFTCSAFVGASDERPMATTLYLPVCAYFPHDAAVTERVAGHLARRGLSAGAYRSLIEGYTNRPLDAGVGMQSWVALQRTYGKPRVTVYLATEASKVFAPGTVPAPTSRRFVEVG